MKHKYVKRAAEHRLEAQIGLHFDVKYVTVKTVIGQKMFTVKIKCASSVGNLIKMRRFFSELSHLDMICMIHADE
jgi:hypothetical protein